MTDAPMQPVSYDDKSAPGAIRGELQRRLNAAGIPAVEKPAPRTGHPYLVVGNVWLKHNVFNAMGTFTADHGQCLPVKITVLGEVFNHAHPYDINDFDWDAIVSLIGGYVEEMQAMEKAKMSKDYLRKHVPDHALVTFDEAIASGRGVILIGPGGSIKNVAIANVTVIQCEHQFGDKHDESPASMSCVWLDNVPVIMDDGVGMNLT